MTPKPPSEMPHAAAVEVPCTINEIGTYHAFFEVFNFCSSSPFDENKKKKEKENKRRFKPFLPDSKEGGRGFW